MLNIIEGDNETISKEEGMHSDTHAPFERLRCAYASFTCTPDTTKGPHSVGNSCALRMIRIAYEGVASDPLLSLWKAMSRFLTPLK